MGEFNELITSNTIFQERLFNVGVCPLRKRSEWACRSQPARLRLKWDIRQKNSPIHLWQMNLTCPSAMAASREQQPARRTRRQFTTDTSCAVKEGFSNRSRSSEVCAMMRGERKTHADHPDRQYQAKLPRAPAHPARRVLHAQPKTRCGETRLLTSLSDGTDKPLRMKIRTGSFRALVVSKRSRAAC